MLRFLASMVIVGVLSFSGAVLYGAYYYNAPGPLSDPATLVFKRGAGFSAIVDDMHRQGVIRYPLLFKAIAAALGDARRFKAGEYQFSAAISPRLVMNMIAEGRVVARRLTVREGLTVREVIDMLKREPALDGDIAASVIDTFKEGSLLPETYHFSYGDDRLELLKRMQTGMDSAIAEMWPKRRDGLPLDTPERALTLASIVERETGVDHERGRVAAVFINRLRKGMKLQSDPTVVYGIERQKGAPMGRDLMLSDLKAPTPYNTYVIDGLPPGPIANPGRAAIAATLNPPDTNELYFVATGTGGHHFASTLAQHNENVRNYRELMRSRR